MSDIGSLQTAAAPAATAGGGGTVSVGEVGLEQLPSRLSQLSRPVVISGTVVGQTDDGATRIRTQAGEVVVRASPPLPADSAVTLQIGAGNPPTRAAAFLTGQPGGTAAALAAPALPPAADEFPTAASPLPSRTPAAPGEEPAVLPQLGSVVPGQVLSVTAPLPRTPAAPPATAATAATAATTPGEPGAGSPAAAQPEPAATLPLVPGATLAVRILAAGPSGVTGAGPRPMPAPGGGPVLSGTIAGATTDGRPILATPQGTLTLALPAPLPRGLPLTVELADPRSLVFSHPEATAGTASRWPALAETLTTLGGLEGALAQSLFTSIVPRPDRRLAAALSFFLDAARRGDARGWLGAEAGDALDKAGRGDLLDRLADNFRSMAHESAQTPPGDWRPLAFPLFDGTAFQRVELFVKAPRDDDEAGGVGGGEPSRRFILDLDLSRLGALQLDGLVKARSRRFDLILRSRDPLPDDLRSELLGAFAASLDAVGFAGGLSFQTGNRHWVRPPPPRRGATGVTA